MKITTLKESLEEQMQLAVKFISSKLSSVQALQGCVLKTDKNKIFLTTTNLNDFFYSSVSAKVEEEGDIIFDIKKALEFLSLLNPGDVLISTDSGSLIIEQGKTKGFFNTFPKEDFHEIPKIEGKDFSFTKEQTEKLPLVLFSASKDETRPTLTGIYFTTQGKKATLVSTDGFRLSLLSYSIKEELKEVAIPASVIQEVVKLAKEKGEFILTLSTEDKLVKFSIGQVSLYSRVLEGDFPPYEKVIPKTSSTTVLIDRQQFIKNIRLVSVFAREQADVVVFDIQKDGIYIRPKTQQVKTSQVYQELESLDGDPLKIAFNYKYVLEFLNVVDSKLVKIELTQSTAPGVFRDEKNNDFLHIIMPLRTEETAG